MDTTKLINEHIAEKRESYEFKKRKFEHWNTNYALYRDKIATNRLTQRQAINIPIMRDTIQTWISKIDEAPELKFKCRGNSNKHKNGEIVMDELWKYYFDALKLDIVDNVDKKIVGLQGRSFKILGMNKGRFFIDLIDPYDIDISPRASPFDLNSAQYIIRTNIFKPLREIIANQKYETEGKEKLKIYMATKEGIIKSQATYDAYVERQQRLKDLGAENFDDYNVSEVLIELNESYKMVWNKEENRFVRHLIIIGADNAVLYNKPIKQALGLSKLPILTWADDPDLNDIWCDGKGDSVRTINKLVNIYLSQDVESRTYRNFGMYFFDTKNGTYQPRAMDPKPFGFYGVPGNPNDVMKQVEIPALNDTMAQIEFLKNMIQSSVAQTPAERGEQTKSRTTLGEVELNLEQSGQRNTVSSKHYRRCWEEAGEIFYELMVNNNMGSLTIYKEAPNGDIQSKDIYPSDFVFPEGYRVDVVMKADSDARDQFLLQKAQYVLATFQNNPVATKIAKRKQLELVGWTTDEIEQAMQAEEQGMMPQTGEVTPPEGQASGKPFNNNQVMQQTTE
jgi:hypothetical protein